MTFVLTPQQAVAQEIVAGPAGHSMLFGGSRSGKTFLHMRNIAFRAIKAPGSRHAALRYRFNAIKASVVMDTFPKVMRLAFPGLNVDMNKTDWVARFPNGSEIWFAGLDDGPRVERVLGMEFSTIFFNECSQIPWESRGIALTRLAQLSDTTWPPKSGPLKPRVFYDCNPPSRSHWTYKLFVAKVDPDTGRNVPHPENYAAFRINPEDNAANISAGYLDTLRQLSPRLQKRFLKGEFADATPNQLFPEEVIDRWRELAADELPQFVRIVVGVDPSGADDIDNADNDEIGIVVGALGSDGNAYLLEDCSVKAGPLTWGRVATSAFDRHEADTVVGETNYGGAMVKQTIQTARPRTPFKKVTASRGKHVRAEPFSALYEAGKVRHVGDFRQLEDELIAFSTFGYTGSGSPNRADAWIWVLAELFPALVKPAEPDEPPEQGDEWNSGHSGTSWMMA